MNTVRVLADGSVISAGPKLARDYYGVLAFQQDPDETSLLTIDWTGYLGTETISSITWTATGLTKASEATSGKTTSVKISAVPTNSHGEIEAALTTSGGRIKVVTIRFYAREM